MKIKLLFAITLLIAVPLAFGAGYLTGSGSKSGGQVTEQGIDNPYESIHSLWVKAEEPPLPGVTVDGADIPVVRSGYSWSVGVGGGRARVVSADSVQPRLNDMSVISVKGGSLIKTRAPERMKEFTLANTALPNIDSYVVPAFPGIYLYRIHCEWFLDQGTADFYFAVEVK